MPISAVMSLQLFTLRLTLETTMVTDRVLVGYRSLLVNRLYNPGEWNTAD